MFEEYALVNAQIKELTDKKDKLKENIIRDMQLKNVKTMKHSMGGFTVSMLKKWEFPKHLTDQQDALDAEFEKAKDTGEAIVVAETPSLRFTAIKL